MKKIDKGSLIYIAGHTGMVGSACVRKFKSEGYKNLLLKTSRELDLVKQQDTYDFIDLHRPEIVILAAAKVGGIQANINNPAGFLFDNLSIQSNVIEACRRSGIELLVNISSSCIYPRECPQPMLEEFLLDGKPEPTNEGYALAKIAGLKMCMAFKKQYNLNSVNLIPCNLYGENDSFDLENSHVLSALVKRFSDAVITQQSEITIWGTGVARREFMHVDDLAEAIYYFVNNPFVEDFINVGWGEDISIKELSQLIAKKVGFKGNIIWDNNKPDGMPRKCMDVTKMKRLNFHPEISLNRGLESVVNKYKAIQKNV